MELTLEPGASVARVAQAEGVNANQVFQWRRAHRNGELQADRSMALVPVVLRAEVNTFADEFFVHSGDKNLIPGGDWRMETPNLHSFVSCSA